MTQPTNLILIIFAFIFGILLNKGESTRSENLGTTIKTSGDFIKIIDGQNLQTADHVAETNVGPRIFPFLQKFFKPPPKQPYRPLNPPISLGDGGYSGSPVETNPNSIKPDCAINRGFCNYDSTYPSGQVNAILDKNYDIVRQLYAALHGTPTNNVHHYNNRTHVSSKRNGHFVCGTEVKQFQPGWARNIRGYWVVVVNSRAFEQVIRVEECKHPSRRCEYLPPCYKSSCVQKYALEKLLTVDPQRPATGPYIDTFEIPSSCSCFVENYPYY